MAILLVAGARIVGQAGTNSACGATDMKDNPKKPEGSREKHEEEERRLDEALEELFPASDPLPTTWTSIGAPDDRPAKTPYERLSDKKGG